jgi:ribonuclease BN (tRNA processing enzyme)
MLDTLTILGGGGWFPAHARHTASALLRDGDSAILIDAGTGFARLIEQPRLLQDVSRLDILLTHFHLDHVAGVAYLPALGIADRTTVWGPGRLLYDAPTSEVLGRVLREPFHPVPLEALDIEVRDLPEHEIELSGTRIALRRQERHSAPTLGLRFDDAFAWITDTAYDEGSAPFAQGCRMLAHEAWFTSGAPRNPDVHTSAAEAARVAADAGISQLLLMHLPPFAAGLDELLIEARAVVPDTALADDGADVSVGGLM